MARSALEGRTGHVDERAIDKVKPRVESGRLEGSGLFIHTREMTVQDDAARPARPGGVLSAILLLPVTCFVGLVMMFGIAMTPTDPGDLINASSPALPLIMMWLVVTVGTGVASWVALRGSELAAKRLAWASVALSTVGLSAFGWLLA